MKSGGTARLALGIIMISVMQTHGNASSAGLAEIGKAFPSLPQTTISLVLTTVSLAIVPGMLLAGALADRFGGKKLILTGFAMMLVFGLSSLFIRSFPLLIAFRILTGLGTGLATPFQTSLIPHHFSGYTAQRLFGIQSAVVSLMGVLFGVAGGALASIRWNFGFLVYVVAVPAMLIILLWLPAERTIPVSTEQTIRPFRVSGAIVYLVSMMFLFGVFVFQYMAGIAYLLELEAIGDAGTAGTCVAMFSGGAFVSSLLYSRLRKALGFGAVPLLMLIAAAGLLLTGFGAWGNAPLITYLLGGLFTGSALGSVMPSVSSRLTELFADSNASMAIAIVMSAFFLATLLSPFVMGLAVVLPAGGDAAGRFVYAGAGMLVLCLLVTGSWRRILAPRGLETDEQDIAVQ